MKKYGWILALFAALALLFVGCPGDPDTPDDVFEIVPKNIEEIFPDTPTSQSKANVTVSGRTATFTVTVNDSDIDELWGELVNEESFDGSEIFLAGFRFEYRSTGMANILIETDDGVYIFTDQSGTSNDGWGALNASQDEWVELDQLFTKLDAGWDSPPPFNPSTIKKLMIGVVDGPANRKFEIRNFSLILDSDYEPDEPDEPDQPSDPNLPGIDPGDDTWYLATAEGGTLKAPDNKRVFTSGQFAYIYFTPDVNLDTVAVHFTTSPSVTITRQAVYDNIGTLGWGNGTVTSGTAIDLSGDGRWGSEKAPVEKSTLKGICLRIDGATTFTLTGVTITTTP